MHGRGDRGVEDGDHRSRDTVVLQSEFFRAGDSAPSFTANMFVSTRDLAPDVAGVQNVWVQNVGCDAGITHFIR